MLTTPDHPVTALAATPRGIAVSVRGLRRSYGGVEAVRGIDLEIERGEIFALLGPNGAGKATTLEILEGFRERSGGEVEVLGVDPADGDRAGRERIGIVLQDSFPEPELTIRECVSLYAGYYSAPRDVDTMLAQVGLADLGPRRCEQLSGGERRRLHVALAPIRDRELLFLDEPTTGFDPAARRLMWDLVESLRSDGATIVLTTHYMDDAERLADRIAVIARGEIVATGTPGSLGTRRQLAAEIRFSIPRGVELRQLPVGIGAPGVDAGGKVRVHTFRSSTSSPRSAVDFFSGAEAWPGATWRSSPRGGLGGLVVALNRFRWTPAAAEAYHINNQETTRWHPSTTTSVHVRESAPRTAR